MTALIFLVSILISGGGPGDEKDKFKDISEVSLIFQHLIDAHEKHETGLSVTSI